MQLARCLLLLAKEPPVARDRNMKVSAVTCNPPHLKALRISAWNQGDRLRHLHAADRSDLQPRAEPRRLGAYDPTVRGTSRPAVFNERRTRKGRDRASSGMFHQSWRGSGADLFLADLSQDRAYQRADRPEF